VRLAGTAIICIVAAFGAAFLVGRALNHETPARAATLPKTTHVAAVATHVTASHKVNKELESQFSPLKAALKPRPKPKPKHRAKAKPKPSVSVTPSPSTSVAPTTPAEPAPTFTEPTPASPPPSSTPSSSSGSSTHHKKSGGSGGSGTTTIGG
jgi:outer membrane biosynthesis protein TonB